MITLSRRLFALSFTLAAVSVVPIATTGIADANAPLAKTQAPGWYRMMLGDFEVTALSDGTTLLPLDQFLSGITPAKVTAALTRAYLKSPFDTSDNAFLINTGTKLVLIDAGAGDSMGPTLGRLVADIKASGYTPEQIDEVYITHMHGDHIGALITGGKLTFPNAIVRAAKADADFWLDQANADKAPAEMKGFFKGAQAAFNPYIAAGKFKPFDGPTDLVPGIKAIPAPGHTPGHTFYQVTSKGQTLTAWGDAMHVASVQFADGSIGLKFDSDSKLAAMTRKAAYADAAKAGYFVALAHVPFPGIGQLRAEGSGYRWYPVNYSSVVK